MNMKYAFARNTVEVSTDVVPVKNFSINSIIEIDGKKYQFIGIAPSGNLLLRPINE